MKQDKCKHCKYYKEGLDGWYIPSCWCTLVGSFDNAETCEHDKDPYTIWDYFAECWEGIFIIIGIGIVALIMSLK